MVCRIIEVGGRRLVAFDSPPPIAPEDGYSIDAFGLDSKHFAQEFKTLDAAVVALGDNGPEVVELTAYALPDPADGDKPERAAEWNGTTGEWGKWRDN